MPEIKMYEEGHMTHEGMRQVLAEGHGVIYKGRIITDPKHLPTPGELASGKPEAEAAVRKSLEAQISQLTAQLNLVGQHPDVVYPVGAHEAGVAGPGEAAVHPDLVGSVPPASGPDADQQKPSDEPTPDEEALNAQAEPGEVAEPVAPAKGRKAASEPPGEA